MKGKLIAAMIVLCLAFSVGFAQARCEPTKFSNVPPNTFECMKTKLQNYGISVPPGNTGVLSGKGISGSFMWDGASNLIIQITGKPFFVSCGIATNEISKFVEQCQGS